MDQGLADKFERSCLGMLNRGATPDELQTVLTGAVSKCLPPADESLVADESITATITKEPPLGEYLSQVNAEPDQSD